MATATTLGAGTTETLNAAGGQTPYVYSIVSGSGTVDSASGLFTATAAGTTVVQVTDARKTVATVTLQTIAVAFAHASASVDSATTTAQVAAGGAPPYSYSVFSGGGSIDAAGQFTAPAGPAAVVIAVADSKGATAQEAITVNAPLVAAMATVTIGGNTTVTVGATGGQGPFSYAVTSGGGSVDATGHFIAPATPGTSVVTITDSLGTPTTTTITINPPLAISPASTTLTASSGQTAAFAGLNGVPPYSFSLISGAGTINAQGIYTVGAVSGAAVVQVADSQGTTVTAQVRALRIRVNGAVFATASDGTNLYVGGRFDAVNPYSAPRVAMLDQVSGNLDTNCDLGTGFLGGNVTAVAAIGNAIYVAGSFNQYHGVSVGKLAKIDAITCALDTVFTGGGGFGQDAGMSVQALAVAGTSIYALGNVNSYRGAAVAGGIVKIDATTGAADPAFVPTTGMDASAAALAVAGSSVYVGGYFTHYSGIAVPYLAKLDAATGAIDASFAAAPGADGAVLALANSPNGLYVGGQFTHFAGVSTALARVDAASGALDTTFTQSVANVSPVGSVLPSGSSVYVAQVPNGSTSALAKIDATTGTVNATFSAGSGFDGAVHALVLANSSLYVGGSFTHYRTANARWLAKIDPVTGVLDAAFTQSTGANNSVSALAATGSRIIAGGAFSTYRGSPVHNIAKFALATDAADAVFDAAAATDGNVIAMAYQASSLYVGGTFSQCGITASYFVAKVDSVSGNCDAVFAAGNGASYYVDALLIHGNALYFAGYNAPRIGKLDLVTGQSDNGFTVNGLPDGPVFSLVDSPAAIYVGGQFQNYGALPAHNLAKIDPVTGALDQVFTQATGAGGNSEYISSLLVAGNSLYAGGYVNSYRGAAAQGLLKLNPASGVLDAAFSQPTGFAGNVEALASTGSSILVAGTFQTYRSAQSFNLAKLDAATGNPDPAFAASIHCDSCDVNFDSLLPVGSDVYVGADAATLYRAEPTYNVFPVDMASGAPSDP